MTVQLSTLRVVPQLDGSGYAAGAKQINTANQSMLDTQRQVAASFTQIDTRISQHGNSLTRLSGKYDSNFVNMQRFGRALNELTGGFERGDIPLRNALTIYDGMYRKHGLLAEASSIAARGQNELAKAIDAANSRLTSQQKIIAANHNTPGTNYAAVNATYQLQDIVTTAAGGMSPGLIGLQQGSQLAGSFAGMGLKEVGATLAGAVGGLLSPVSLIAVGLTAATAAAIQFGSQALSPVKTMDDAVKAHADNVDLLRKRYGELGETAKASSSVLGPGFLDASIRSNEQILRAVSRQEEKRYVSTLQSNAGLTGYLSPRTNVKVDQLTGLTGGNADFQQPVNAFLDAIRRGNPDLGVFRASIEETFNKQLGSAEYTDNLARSRDAVLLLGESFLTSAGSIKVLGDDGKETTQSLEPFSASIARLKLGLADRSPDAFSGFIKDVTEIGERRGLLNVADQIIVLGKSLLDLNQQTRELDARKLAIFNTIGSNGRLLSQGTMNRDDAGNLALYESQQAIAAQRSREAYEAQIAGLGAKSPAEREAAARRAEAARYDQSETPEARRQRIDQAGSMARLQMEHQLREAQEDRTRSLQRSLADQQMEISLIGKTSIEASALRKEYELIANLKADAARNNTIVDPAEIERIKAATAEMRGLNEQLATQQLRRDLQVQRSDMFLSASDLAVTQRLRSAGLPEDLSSPEAGYMRQTMRMQETKTAITGFFTDFRSALESNGGKVGKALGDTLLNALVNQLTKASDLALDRVANIIVKSLFGEGGGGSGILPSSATGFGGAAVKAVTGGVAANDNNGALGMSVYAAATKSIESGGNYGIMGPVTRTGDRAYGAYQVMGANVPSWTQGALGRSLSPSQFLADHSAQDAVFNWKFGGYVSKYGPSGAAQAWFGGPGSVGRGAGWSDSLGTTGTEYVNKFNSALANASKNVGTFGSGLGQIGQTLSSSFFPAAPAAASGGGGGLFSWIGGLFGGGKTASVAGGGLSKYLGLTGLFEEGTEFAPGGLAMVGEGGREIVNLPRGAQVIPNHRTESLLGAANNNRGGNGRAANGILQVVVQGANGDEQIRKMVDQGVSKALEAQQIESERGGFASTQQHYTRRKG
ncbi:phage tail length tape measure family protein [Rhizobium sp. SGZ-381]|uniref:phage tail length tape measure family protein n=1 Tax=Rhizobium sp. SGZ-381 TaxID=3342800 RepID=UPI0036708E00